MVDELKKLASWYHVSKSKYLGPVRFRTLLKIYGDKIVDIFNLSDKELLEIPGITKQVVKGIREQEGKFDDALAFMEKQLSLMEKCRGGIVTIDKGLYPKFLKSSTMCHPILYYKGNINKFADYKKAIAIVGSRKAINKSIEIAKNTAKDLVNDNWVIVSGLAFGIDSAAHTGALEGNGLTIAVLGCGPDVVYPSKSKEIYQFISERGLILSEFPFGTKVEEWKLRKRNKTIVAAALGAFVVQSTSKGGAMNAVKACQEQKKRIFTLIPIGSEKMFSGNIKIREELSGISVTPENAPLDIRRVFTNG